jgi:hypothetical protein
MIVVLAGGSGFLGRALAARLREDGHTLRTLTRRPRRPEAGDIGWLPDGTSGPWATALADADVVVNLAGEGIADKRWTAARKRALRDSRVLSTRSLARALADGPSRPRAFLMSSAIGFYGAHGDEPVTESTPPGGDFLARLCVEWEAEARRAASPAIVVVFLRTGIVLDPRGGALGAMLPPFRFGLGGPMGSGRQYMPWIHLQDWVEMARYAIERARAGFQGALATSGVASLQASALGGAAPAAATPGRNGGVMVWNATAPVPVTNAEFARTLGRVLRRPAVIPAPSFALRLLLGELSTALLTGARVLPAAAEQAGFRFRFRELEPALRNLLDRRAVDASDAPERSSR